MGAKRSNLGTRLTALEQRAQRDRTTRPSVTVFLPIKDGEDRAPGTEVWPGNVSVVWYRAEPQAGHSEPT